MDQKYKAIYFSDFPSDSASRKSITLAFGKRTNTLYEKIKNLSSLEIKELLGTDSYLELLKQSEMDDLPLNTHCMRLLKRSLNTMRKRSSQLSLLPVETRDQLFDPISVTFKGGSKEPFICWYPFLEGYSPQFVEEIIKKYAPNANSILDPFSGTGTTVFAASNLNKKSFYCEINPTLQFITNTKINVRSLDRLKRYCLSNILTDINNNIDNINAREPDYFLHESYKNIFGNSVFFEPSIYEKVLKARSWIDDIALENPLAADLITIAILSSLVPVSNMKRAGDLRYKTKNEKRLQKINFIHNTSKQINQIIRDIQNDIEGIKIRPYFLCQEASAISKIPNLNIDTVITSPPYVNGTNYFRNTKIELWFLRCLKEKDDLKRFRLASLTSGINDVSNKKIPLEIHPEVGEIVKQLEAKAYDQRIPKMVACYFNEITNVFDAIRPHLANNAMVAIDIGDSCYSGVHVPVDTLLTACLHDIGFISRDEITLRRRKSRGGMLLKQCLLVFDYLSKSPVKPPIQPSRFWRDNWKCFKETLPHQKTPFSKRNWGHSWHSLCSYPGKLKPAIAHHLVKTFVPKTGKVLDPFAGVGTIPFEAALQGKKAYGFEINPSAYVIAKAKLQKPLKEDCLAIIDSLRIYLNRNSPNSAELEEVHTFGYNGKICDYYHKKTLAEIILARRYFKVHRTDTPEHAFVLACLLHILHGNRPYALSRCSHPITPYKPSGFFEYRSLVGHLEQKVIRNLQDALPFKFSPGKVFHHDATKWWPTEINDLDAVITSPPFFDSTRFYLANWLRLWFAGWSSRDFQERPKGFLEEQQKKSFDSYVPILRQARERLKPNGVLIFHLGKSKKCDMAYELASLSKGWFTSAESFDESVLHCESHGIRDKGTVTSHQYLLLY